MSPVRRESGPPPAIPEILLRRTSPSLPDEQAALVDAVVAVLTDRGWVDAEGEVWLRLCLEEAVANAMLHGNQGDPELTVELVLGRDGDRWVLTVADRGRGFDPADLPVIDGDDPETLLREHGRGVHLMQEWLDELTWYQDGSTVLLARRIDPADHADPE